MSGRDGILFLVRYLYDNTDPEHPVNSVQLKKIMQDNGFAADPRTIHKWIVSIENAGLDLFIRERNGVPAQYAFGSHVWDMKEIMLLSDALAAAPFLTKDRTETMIRKVSGLAGGRRRRDVLPVLKTPGETKAPNDNVLHCTEIIAECIRDRKTVSFRKYGYNAKKRLVQQENGRFFFLSPYDILWKNGLAYAVGYLREQECIAAVRMDRMGKVNILDRDYVSPPEGYRAWDYLEGSPEQGEECCGEVRLRCDISLLDGVVERLGKKTVIENAGEKEFDAVAEVRADDEFLAWVFRNAGRMTVVSPEPVREMYLGMLKKATEDLMSCAACGEDT